MQVRISIWHIVAILFCCALTWYFTRVQVKSAASERHIEYLEQDRQRVRGELAATTRILDSLILTNVSAANQSITKARSNATFYQTIPKRLEQIRTTTANLSDSALRREFAEY